MNNNWQAKSTPEILKVLETTENGLSAAEAAARLKKYGANKLPEGKGDSLWLIFLRQFQSPLIYVLLVASLAVFVIGEITDGAIILAVLVFNAVVGMIQEGKAQNTLLALKKFTETRATVWRDGREIIVSDKQIVPGDIIVLQAGEKVPAEARLISAHNLKIDEASLTGESKPVHKTLEISFNQESDVIGQKNMIFKGTDVVAGNGKAIVVATGLDTFIGRIAKQVAVVDTEIPLKTNLRYLSRLIIWVVAGVSSLLFVLGLVSGETPRNMFTMVVSLAVSIIPEGLPIVMTLILATGVWRMAKRNALVKRLQAVEALGQARVIAVDKTGTVTRNELVVQKVYAGGELFEIGGIGYEPKGEVRSADKLIDPIDSPNLALAGKLAALSADARVMFVPETKQWRVAGDPTEAAMLVFAQKLGFHSDELRQNFQLIAENPFDYRFKYHATAYKNNDKKLLTVAGAPEVILDLCQKAIKNNRSYELAEKDKKDLEEIFFHLSREGLRVVAVAEGTDGQEINNLRKTKNLTFVGFLGIRDALRPEVAGAIRRATDADVKIIMITGDHKITARAIAREAGIYQEGDEILTGEEIDVLSEEALAAKLKLVSVFARVSPEHKLKIIQAYKARGEIVAMTGDGVNDAPSLVAADLGVAMGEIGTEVAKEAADIILLDDNFKSIVAAIEEGRSIYKTIKKVILYLFSTNFGELLVIIGALVLGYPLPILAVQIIWLNFVTDGFTDVALAMEPKEKGLLRGDFERPKKYLIDALMLRRMIVMAIPMALIALLFFKEYFIVDLMKAQTICLTVLAVSQWFNAFNCRSETKSILQISPFSNLFLIAATILVIGLQLLAVYNPVLQGLLHTTALTAKEWLLIVPAAASVLLVEEARKLFKRLWLAFN